MPIVTLHESDRDVRPGAPKACPLTDSGELLTAHTAHRAQSPIRPTNGPVGWPGTDCPDDPHLYWAVEDIGSQAGEQLAREPTVTITECLGGRASPLGENDQRRPATIPRHPLRRVPGLRLDGPGTIECVSHEFYRIADGLIAEEWICSDMATLLRQLS